ncbi:MAG: GntR family transcriptional regulator [Mesorhizobium sp.]|nr:GntR family transcriptional regulator [Mesorhizobium sp.]
MDIALRMREPIAPQIVAALRQGIVELRLRPGEALSESEIAARFGVSRQPVREAFIKLSEAGLVEIRPSRGTYVMKISARELANARFVREAIECDIANNAGRLAGPHHVAELEDLLARQRAADARNDYRCFNDLDEAFHRAIASIVDCEYAWRIVEAARVQTDRVRFLSLPNASPMPLLIRQHETIVDRLAANDPEGTEAAMRRHLREILVALPQIAASNPDLFADTELPAHTRGLTPAD